MKKYSLDWWKTKFQNNSLTRYIHHEHYIHLVCISRDVGLTLETDLPFKRNSMDDLRCFTPTETWHDKEAFLKSALAKLGAGVTAYTLSENGVLAFVAWISADSEKSHFGSVQQTVYYPEKTSNSYEGYVHPGFRGRQLFKHGVSYFVRQNFEHTDSQRLIAATEGGNIPALRGHTSNGWENLGTLHLRIKMGKKEFFTNNPDTETDYVFEPKAVGEWDLVIRSK
jgi:hypothetical protein